MVLNRLAELNPTIVTRDEAARTGLGRCGPKNLSPSHNNLHDSAAMSLSFGLKWLSKSPPLVSLPG